MDNFYKKISNSRFYSFGDKLADYMAASLLWFLFCIPVVTFIPSTCALYYTCHKMKKKEIPISKLFMSSFKDNLKQGVIINIIYILYSFIAGMSIFFGYYGIGNIKLPDAYFPFSFITLLPIIFTLPFAIALLSRYENTSKSTIINAFTLSAMNPGATFYAWILMIVTLALLIVFPPSILGLPALFCGFIINKFEKIFNMANQVEANRNLEPEITDIEDIEEREEE